MELVREIAMDGVLYMPGPEEPTRGTDLSKAACLNRVLRKIYPRGTEPKATDLVAFLDDDQVGCKTISIARHALFCVGYPPTSEALS